MSPRPPPPRRRRRPLRPRRLHGRLPADPARAADAPAPRSRCRRSSSRCGARSCSPPGSRARSSTASRTAGCSSSSRSPRRPSSPPWSFSADALWALLPLMALLGIGVAVSQPAEFALVPAAAGEGDVARANGLMETARCARLHRRPAGRRRARRRRAAGARARAQRAVVRRRRRAPRWCCAPAAGPRRARHDAPVRARDGFAFLLRERDLAITLGGAVAALAVFSISVTAEPFFVTEVLDGGALVYGILLTAWTLGMAAGAGGGRPPRAARRARGRRARRGRAPGRRDRRRGDLPDAVARADRLRLRRRRARRQERPAAHADPRARHPRRCAAARSPPTTAPATAPSSGRSALGGVVVGAFGARAALLDRRRRPRPASASSACSCSPHTPERSVIHARVEG